MNKNNAFRKEGERDTGCRTANLEEEISERRVVLGQLFVGTQTKLPESGLPPSLHQPTLHEEAKEEYNCL